VIVHAIFFTPYLCCQWNFEQKKWVA
jgi:hypothetical protein